MTIETVFEIKMKGRINSEGGQDYMAYADVNRSYAESAAGVHPSFRVQFTSVSLDGAVRGFETAINRWRANYYGQQEESNQATDQGAPQGEAETAVDVREPRRRVRLRRGRGESPGGNAEEQSVPERGRSIWRTLNRIPRA